MKLGLDVNLKQKQQLTVNHQLIQSMNILQYNTYELNKYIDIELEKNPLLEKDESDLKRDDEIDWGKFANNISQSELHDFSDNTDTKEKLLSFSREKKTLKNVLISQLHLLDLTFNEILIGEVIIDFIDERGYLISSPEEISRSLDLDEMIIENVLEKIRKFDPSGVGGSNLKECLTIQLKNMGVNDNNLYSLVERHLEDIAYHKDQKIIKEFNINEITLEEYRAIIQSLDPKPGLKYYVEEPNYIIPEIFVDLIDNKVIVEINESNVPTLKINEYYLRLLKKNLDEPTKEFIRSKLKGASFIINSILQRRETIKNISKVIFEKQKDFIKSGDAALVPMTLKDIARTIDVHESTVSRAVKNKYAVTPRGIYSLKYFLATGLPSTYGEDVSINVIKEKIKEIIKNENKKKPLSDQTITNLLKEEGYEISRRTVTKYRDQLLIPSTRERKR